MPRKPGHEGDVVFKLQDIADTEGLTRERIRQIESIALRKFRAGLLAKGITAEAVREHFKSLGNW